MSRLSGRTVIVTGAASGIGRAAAVCCAKEGAQVFGADLDAKGLESCADEIGQAGGRIETFELDVRDEARVTAMFDAVRERTDRVDGLVHAAGILEGAAVPVEDFESLTWDRVLDINLKGSFLVARGAVPLLEKAGNGVLVLISSGAGVKGGSSSVAYGSSKGGVHGLSLVLASQLESRGIRVHAVCPGALATPLKLRQVEESARKTGQDPSATIERLGDPAGVGKVLAWLLSEEADYVRGTIFTR